MDKIDFSGCQLHVSIRSPFARRVRLAFLENGLDYQEVIRDVWKPNPDFLSINPLHRVPAVVLKNGQALTESSMILDLFYQGQPPLAYKTTEEMLLGYEWSGHAVGLIEKTIERFLETLRPEPSRDPEFIEDLPVVSKRVLDLFEKKIGSNRTLLGDRLCQADLDLLSALGYMKFRFDENLLQNYPNTRRYYESLAARPSAAQTAPV